MTFGCLYLHFPKMTTITDFKYNYLLNLVTITIYIQNFQLINNIVVGCFQNNKNIYIYKINLNLTSNKRKLTKNISYFGVKNVVEIFWKECKFILTIVSIKTFKFVSHLKNRRR